MSNNTFSRILELGRDSLVYGIGSAISQLAALFLIPFYTRALDPEDYGVIAISGLFSQLLMPVINIGMDAALFRYFSMSKTESERNTYFSIAFALKLIVSLVIVVVVFMSYSVVNRLLFHAALTREIYIIICLTIFVTNIGSTGFVALRSMRQPGKVVVLQVSALLFAIAVSVYLVIVQDLKLYGALLASLMSQTFLSIGLVFITRNYFTALIVAPDRVRQLLRYGTPYVPHRLQATIMSVFTLFMINEYMGLKIAGLYAVADKLTKPLWLIVSSVQNAWVPYKYQIHKNYTEMSRRTKLFSGIVSNYWLFLIAFWVVSCWIAPIIYDKLIDSKYMASMRYYPFLALLPLAKAFYFTSSTGLEIWDSQTILPKATLVGMVILVSLSFIAKDFHAPYSLIMVSVFGTIVSGLVVQKFVARRIMRIRYPFATASGVILMNIILLSLFAFDVSVMNGVAIGFLSLLSIVAAFFAINHSTLRTSAPLLGFFSK